MSAIPTVRTVLILVVGFGLVFQGCASTRPSFGGRPRGELTSIVALLSRPGDFDGKRVMVEGVLHLEFEGDRLCLDRDSAETLVIMNCLYVVLSEPMEADYQALSRLNGLYVLVDGLLKANKTPAGQMCVGCWAADLTDVTRVVVSED